MNDIIYHRSSACDGSSEGKNIGMFWGEYYVRVQEQCNKQFWNLDNV